ncbi:MAG: peptidoglycan-binding domain-containing protein [Candidatus Omnitrophota bacterium]|nr:peptidoglycan-binding domain-containing protein [Candidatus Omnitrophota bacterium]
MRTILKVYLIILAVGIISFSLIGCSKKQSEMPSGEMITQSAVSQTQLNAEALTPQALARVEPTGALTTQKDVFSAEDIQTALKNAGYYKGAIDGKIGAKSRKAIEDFQKDNSLVMDGKVGAKTWSKLQGYLNASPEQKTGD